MFLLCVYLHFVGRNGFVFFFRVCRTGVFKAGVVTIENQSCGVDSWDFLIHESSKILDISWTNRLNNGCLEA